MNAMQMKWNQRSESKPFLTYIALTLLFLLLSAALF